MLALELSNEMVKAFMGRLLREDIFDIFDARSVDIVTNVRIGIDTGCEEGFMPWELLRPLVYTIVKESVKPKNVKIVFSYNSKVLANIHANAAALFLNLTYENDNVTFTTATAQREFAMDKSLDDAWDGWVLGFFKEKGLVVAEL